MKTLKLATVAAVFISLISISCSRNLKEKDNATDYSNSDSSSFGNTRRDSLRLASDTMKTPADVTGVHKNVADTIR